MRAPLSAALRLIGWLWVLARHDALAPREITPLLPFWARMVAHLLHLFAGSQARAGRPGQRLGHAFEHLGPVAIKLGQVLATRADIFGTEFARDLGRLKDKLAPFPTSEARAEIERSLGMPVEALFSAMPPTAAEAPAWIAAGRGLRAYAPLAERVSRAGVKILDDLLPSAATMARLAAPRLRAGQTLPATSAAPVYLRDRVAEPQAGR